MVCTLTSRLALEGSAVASLGLPSPDCLQSLATPYHPSTRSPLPPTPAVLMAAASKAALPAEAQEGEGGQHRLQQVGTGQASGQEAVEWLVSGGVAVDASFPVVGLADLLSA
jgi:hypothetical protein